MASDPVDAAWQVIQALDALGVPYLIGGSLASTVHGLVRTATPHKGDPANFALFVRLLDRDAYADVKSIQEAMQRRSAPF